MIRTNSVSLLAILMFGGLAKENMLKHYLLKVDISTAEANK